jgi:hypothetical protein
MSASKPKKYWAGVRLPLPEKTGGPHSSKKGKRGYNRKRAQKEAQEVARDRNLWRLFSLYKLVYKGVSAGPIVKWYNGAFALRKPEFDSPWVHHVVKEGHSYANDKVCKFGGG